MPSTTPRTDCMMRRADLMPANTVVVPVANCRALESEMAAVIREAHDNKQRARAFEKDAMRYRKVRRGQHWSVIDGAGNNLQGDALDSAADAAPAVR